MCYYRGMATSLLKPRIALVANSIVFQREENRLISLDTLTMQVRAATICFSGGTTKVFFYLFFYWKTPRNYVNLKSWYI